MTGYKTLLFSLILSAAGVLQTFDFTTVIPPNHVWSGVALVGVGAAVAWLRALTTAPIGGK